MTTEADGGRRTADGVREPSRLLGGFPLMVGGASELSLRVLTVRRPPSAVRFAGLR